jgi:hypothetical protein
MNCNACEAGELMVRRLEPGARLLLVAANPTRITPLLALLAEASASGPSATIWRWRRWRDDDAEAKAIRMQVF